MPCPCFDQGMTTNTRLAQTPIQRQQKHAPIMTPLFREAALAAERYQCFGPVVVVTPPSAMLTLWVSMLAVAFLIASTRLIEIPERARAVGILLPANGLLKVRARRAGWVERLSVENDTPVERGQLLMWLSDGQQAPDRRPESTLRIASLNNELDLLEITLAQDLRAAEARRLVSRRRLELIRSQLLAAEQEVRTRSNRAEVEQRRARRVAALANAARIANQTADEHAARALAAEAETHLATQRVLALRDEIAALEHAISEAAAMPELLRTSTQMRRETLLREIARSELLSAIEVTAPDDGKVAGLAVRAGSYVQAGQVLLTLYDPGAPLEARLYVSADNAGFIRIGQPVELRLRAYPHQLVGTVPAVVTAVSGVAIPARETAAGPALSGPVFEIRAALANDSVAGHGAVWQLPPGTSFEADLIRRRWPLYRWLWRSTVAQETRRA